MEKNTILHLFYNKQTFYQHNYSYRIGIRSPLNPTEAVRRDIIDYADMYTINAVGPKALVILPLTFPSGLTLTVDIEFHHMYDLLHPHPSQATYPRLLARTYHVKLPPCKQG